MSPRRDRTEMGGSCEAFRATHWSLLFAARTLDPVRHRAAVGEVMGRYWKPIYCYLRRKGWGNEEAKDLTQSFFEAVLRRDLIQQAEPGRGKFRTLLLTCLGRFVTNVHRDMTAKKRTPPAGLVRLDVVDLPEIPDPNGEISPEDAFHYAWASELLDGVLAEVERQCRQEGLAVHWELFEARVLRPTMEGCAGPSMAELCARYAIENEAKASNMMVAVKRRLRKALIADIRNSMAPGDEVDREIAELLESLSKRPKGAAGSG